MLARAELSKAALAAKSAAAPALAAEDAAQVAAREAIVARVGRELALNFLSEMSQLRGLVKALAARANRPEEVATMTTEEALRAMRDAASTISRVVDVAQKAIQTERLVLGAPTAVLGVVAMNEPAITLDAAAAEVAAAQRALARLKKHEPEEDASGSCHVANL